MAYQFVIATGGPVTLTPEGRREIRQIRKQLEEISESGAPNATIAAQVSALMKRLAAVLQTEVVPAGGDNNTGNQQQGPGGSGPQQPISSPLPPTTNPSASPSPGPSPPAPSPSPSALPSPSPTA